jgi:hypothetical protein
MPITTKLTSKEIKEYFDRKPVQVKRAARNAINKITRLIKKELGGSIPKRAGSSVAGFRRVRSRSSRSTVKKARRSGGVQESSVFMGTNDIAARFAGKPRQIGSDVRAGRHLFRDSFIVEMSNGFRGVFKEVDGKLKQQTFRVAGAEALSIRARNKYVSTEILGREVNQNLELEFKKGKN